MQFMSMIISIILNNKYDTSTGKNALVILLNYKYQYDDLNTEINYKNTIMLLYSAEETLEGTEQEDIPEYLQFENEKLQLKHICRREGGWEERGLILYWSSNKLSANIWKQERKSLSQISCVVFLT